MTHDLTNEEITILIESLDAWVNRHSSGELLGDLLTSMLDGKISAEAKVKRDEERNAKKLERQLEQDTATLLKAKLIRLRQKGMIPA